MEGRFFEITDPVSYVRELGELERELGFPRGSLVTLVFNSDEWRFVIHGHALSEGAVSQMLSAALDERLAPVFEQLELGKASTGKLEFAKALGFLSDDERGFIRTLSKLRNLLAHDLRHLDFTFEAHIGSMDPQQKAAFFRHFGFGLEEPRHRALRHMLRGDLVPPFDLQE